MYIYIYISSYIYGWLYVKGHNIPSTHWPHQRMKLNLGPLDDEVCNQTPLKGSPNPNGPKLTLSTYCHSPAAKHRFDGASTLSAGSRPLPPLTPRAYGVGASRMLQVTWCDSVGCWVTFHTPQNNNCFDTPSRTLTTNSSISPYSSTATMR